MGSAVRDQFPFTSLQSKQSMCETTAIVSHTGSSGTAYPFSEGIGLDRMGGEKRVCFVAFFFPCAFLVILFRHCLELNKCICRQGVVFEVFRASCG